MAAFKGKIDIWDVVNEFYAPEYRGDTVTSSRKNTLWKKSRIMSSRHWNGLKGNPDANLILNNFDIIPDKDTFKTFDITPRKRLINSINELKQRAVRLMDWDSSCIEPRDDWYAPQKVWDTFDQVGALGYPLHITEFTPRSSRNAVSGGWRDGVWTEECRRQDTEQFLRLCFGHPNVVPLSSGACRKDTGVVSQGGLVRGGLHNQNLCLKR